MAERPRILIIDDDPVALDTYGRILAAGGYVVSTAPCAEAAMAALDRTPPHAIVIDLHLAGASGLELLRHIRRDRGCYSPPVALVTADYLLDEVVPLEVEQLGARLWFKPLWPDDLIRLAEDLVRGGTAVAQSE